MTNWWGFCLGAISGDPAQHEKDTPPEHPHQEFDRLCQRIAANDESLEELLVWQDPIPDVRRLAEALAKNHRLRRIVVSTRFMAAPGFDVLCRDGLRNAAGLEDLNFSGTALSARDVRVLGGCLPRKLDRLDLSRCRLDDPALEALCDGLDESGTVAGLSRLQLGRNVFSDGVVLARLVNALSARETDGDRRLGRLILESNQLGSEGTLAFLASVAPGVLRSLRVLDLSRTGIRFGSGGSSGCLHPLGRVLSCCPGLLELRLDRNRAGPAPSSGETTADRSDPHRSLRLLSLRLCRLQDAHVQSLAGWAPWCAELDLTNNRIGTEGAIALVSARSLCGRLVLSHNQASDGTALAAVYRRQLEEAPATTGRDSATTQQRRLPPRRVVLQHNGLHINVLREFDFWARLEATGARNAWAAAEEESLATWGLVLERARDDPEVLYYILSHTPGLLLRHGCRATNEEQ